MAHPDVEANRSALMGLDRSARQNALTGLWSACEGIVEDLVHQYVVAGCGVETADVSQQAALTVVENVTSGSLSRDPSPDELSALSRMLALRIREFLRAERRRFGRQVTVDDAVLERALARRASPTRSDGPSGRALTRALEQLSPRQRAVITRIYFDDAPVAAIATSLEVTPQAITALHRRALQALRKKLVELPLP